MRIGAKSAEKCAPDANGEAHLELYEKHRKQERNANRWCKET